MTANQINYDKNLETARSNKANEQLSRQRMWNDWMIANLQAQTAKDRMATDTAINQAQLESKEFTSALDRQEGRRQFDVRNQTVDVPNVAINVTDAENRKAQTEVSRQRMVLDTIGNLLGIAGRSGFMSLFGS